MKELRFILIIVCSKIICSCDYNREKALFSYTRNQTVEIIRYDFERNRTGIDTSFLEILANKDSVLFKYKVSEGPKDKTTYEYCKYYYNRDTVLYFQGKLCPLIVTKEFIINENRLSLKKFYYDEELSNDDETTIYFNDSIGILSLYNDGWMSIIGTFQSGYYSKKLNELLLKDTTGFFPQGLDCLPPPFLIESGEAIFEEKN